MTHRLLSTLAAASFGLASALLVAGCGSSSSGGGEFLAGPATASVTTLGGGIFGDTPPEDRGPAGPRVEVLDPGRGSVTSADRIAVEGYVTEVDAPVAELHVDGVSVPFDADGAWSAEVDLEPGINTIVVEAWDQAGTRSEGHVSVLGGVLGDETAELPAAGSLRVTDGGFDVIEPEVAAEIMAQKAEIVRQVLATNVDDVELKGFDFRAVDVFVDAVPGGVEFELVVDDILLQIKASARVLLVFSKSLEGNITAPRLRIRGKVDASVAGGQPQARVTGVTAETVALSVPDWASGERRRIEQGLEDAFASAVADNLQTALEDAFGSRSTSGTLTRDVVGNELQVDWRLDRLAFDDFGATATFAANARPTQAAYGELVTGSLTTQEALAELVGGQPGGPNVAVAVHQDTLNRALHAAWRAGALQVHLDQASFAQGFGGNPVQLDTTALIASAPELADLLPPDLPLTIDLEGLLPPVVVLRPQDPQLLDLQIGGLAVKLNVIHPTEGPVELLDAVYSVRVPVNLFQDGGRVRLEPAAPPELHADVRGFVLPGTRSMVDEMTRAAGPQIFTGSVAQVQGLEIPTVRGLTMTGLAASSHDTSLVVLGNLTTAPPPQPTGGQPAGSGGVGQFGPR